jgi:hypothetical protein
MDLKLTLAKTKNSSCSGEIYDINNKSKLICQYQVILLAQQLLFDVPLSIRGWQEEGINN